MGIGGSKYIFVITDTFTRLTCVFFLNECIKNFIKRSGNEFKLKRVDELCDDLDIKHEFFWPSTLHNQIAMLRGRIRYSLICG